MNEQTCTDCRRLKVREPTGRVRYCADGNYRCVAHRAMWLERMGVWKPVKEPPAEAGRQAAMPW